MNNCCIISCIIRYILAQTQSNCLLNHVIVFQSFVSYTWRFEIKYFAPNHKNNRFIINCCFVYSTFQEALQLFKQYEHCARTTIYMYIRFMIQYIYIYRQGKQNCSKYFHSTLHNIDIRHSNYLHMLLFYPWILTLTLLFIILHLAQFQRDSSKIISLNFIQKYCIYVL